MEIVQGDLSGDTLHNYFSETTYSFIVPLARNAEDTEFMSGLMKYLEDGSDEEDGSRVKCNGCNAFFSEDVFGKHSRM